MTNKRKLKSVSFNPTTETHHLVEPEEDHSPQHEQQIPKEEHWYSSDDLLYIKYCSLKKAMTVRADHSANLHHPSSYSNTLLAAYLQCCGSSIATMANTNPESLTKTQDDTIIQQHLSQHHPTQLHHLAARLARATHPSWRGLEFHSVCTVRLERAKRRQYVRQAVLSIQRDYYEWCASSETTASCSLEDRLRQVSERGSMATALFAQVLGHADALAAQQYSHQHQHHHRKRDGEATLSTTTLLPCSKKARLTLSNLATTTTISTKEGNTTEVPDFNKHLMLPSFADAPTKNVDLSSSQASPRGVVVPEIVIKA
ncbi:hypothetical protein MHU86_12019 [Fragilaria crotonensis]|nr:hypothetical protein MHU86_12019 [Fragilaria crotonensis]